MLSDVAIGFHTTDLSFDKHIPGKLDSRRPWRTVCAYRTLTLTLTLLYILVVGQFGLATGSGARTQSNVHATSRVHQINNVHAPLPKSWSTQTRLEPYPSSSAQ